MLEESFEVLTNLQEDPKIQCLEREVCELQQQYDNIKGTMKMVALTQRLAQMQQTKALKEQVDVSRHKEVVLNACVQPWFDEAFVIIVTIEGQLEKMQGTQEQIQGRSSDTVVSEQCLQQIQQATAGCDADLAVFQAELEGLHVKIFTPTQ